ncbi:olfactory receptor 5B12-like [Phascolarctos cinereus]|uniref:Olfactory receptor n=1 Tax=Phascolarctos cinereus TaxID=38626 RepID=A0A6P5JKY3_PHACI|nr:olfactory receptor 5B12-like [Phascolarctos cinereus]
MAFMENSTDVNGFILVGLTDIPELQAVLIIICTLIYIITLVGNLSLIALIWGESTLHTPMYFFLSSLSLVDLGSSSAIIPKMIAGVFTGDKTISYNGCATQMFFFVIFVTTENYLLASMAYDRHVAVCKPLHYSTIMSSRMCVGLTISSYVCGSLNSSVHTGCTFSLSFCSSNIVNHFFCDILPILTLSCSHICFTELLVCTVGAFHIAFALLVIVTSYLSIFIAILRIHSNEGRQKAFFTSASHIFAVSLFYGATVFIYLQPSSAHSMDTDKMASVFYTMIIPMLNPLVYSLRNKDVKNAFRKLSGKVAFTLGPPKVLYP